jgi:hypothetical protein
VGRARLAEVYVTISSRHADLVQFFTDFGFLIEACQLAATKATPTALLAAAMRGRAPAPGTRGLQVLEINTTPRLTETGRRPLRPTLRGCPSRS